MSLKKRKLSLKKGDADGDLGFSMVSRRWDPGIIIGISICADSYHGDWKWGSLSRFLGFDLGINRGIFGGIRKVPIRLYWNSISNVINVESRIYEGSISGTEVLMVPFFIIEIQRHNQRLGFLGFGNYGIWAYRSGDVILGLRSKVSIC